MGGGGALYELPLVPLPPGIVVRGPYPRAGLTVMVEMAATDLRVQVLLLDGQSVHHLPEYV